MHILASSMWHLNEKVLQLNMILSFESKTLCEMKLLTVYG